MMKLRIAGITRESVVDGPGIRFVVFTQGCIHNCPGCHNPETHDLNGGYEIDTGDILGEIRNARYISGITFSGGDPFLQARSLAELAESIKGIGLNIVAYTGFTFEELIKSNDADIKRMLNFIDILIDGRFIISQKDLSLKFRGSRNQRVIDVKSSIKRGIPVLFLE